MAELASVLERCLYILLIVGAAWMWLVLVCYGIIWIAMERELKKRRRELQSEYERFQKRQEATQAEIDRIRKETRKEL